MNKCYLTLAICVSSVLTGIRATIENKGPSLTANKRGLAVGKSRVRVKATENLNVLVRPPGRLATESLGTEGLGELQPTDSLAMAALKEMEEQKFTRGPVEAECHGKPKKGDVPWLLGHSSYESDSSMESTDGDQTHTSRLLTRTSKSAAGSPKRASSRPTSPRRGRATSPRKVPSRGTSPRRASSTPVTPKKGSSPKAGSPRPRSFGEDITNALERHRRERNSPDEKKEKKAVKKKDAIKSIVSHASAVTSFFEDDVQSSEGSCDEGDFANPIESNQRNTSRTVAGVPTSNGDTRRPVLRSSSTERGIRSSSTERRIRSSSAERGIRSSSAERGIRSSSTGRGIRSSSTERGPRAGDQPSRHSTEREHQDRSTTRNRASSIDPRHRERDRSSDPTRHRDRSSLQTPSSGTTNASAHRRTSSTERIPTTQKTGSPKREHIPNPHRTGSPNREHIPNPYRTGSPKREHRSIPQTTASSGRTSTPQGTIPVVRTQRTSSAGNSHSDHRRANPDERVRSGTVPSHRSERDARNPEEHRRDSHRRDDKSRQGEKYDRDRGKIQSEGQQRTGDKSAPTRSSHRKVEEIPSDKLRHSSSKIGAKPIIQQHGTSRDITRDHRGSRA